MPGLQSMIPPPLNGTKDDAPAQRIIAGHRFDPLTDRCSCGKIYSEVAPAPRSAVNDTAQANLWCHNGTMSLYEWNEIQTENQRIFNCARS